MGGLARLGAGALLLATSGCGPRRAELLPHPPYTVVRVGPERLAFPYADPRLELKLELLERINRDRAAHGLAPLAYEPRASRAGDAFCLEAALRATSGHFDLLGRAPYLRWTLAGGVDYHAQNASAYSVSSGRLDRPLRELLLEAHESMLAERTPDDGHRRTILDAHLTHVGIGLASFGGEFRMSQEFTSALMDWVALPDRPLREGEPGYFAGRPQPPWQVALVEILYEPAPRPLGRQELARRRGYSYPPPRRRLSPRPPLGLAARDGAEGAFEVRRDGSFAASFPLDAGAGHYFVVCHLSRSRGGPLVPATAALLMVEP